MTPVLRALPGTTRLGITLLVLSCAAGCAPYGGRQHTGSFTSMTQTSATLDLSFITAVQPAYQREYTIPIGSRWQWHPVLRDAQGRSLPVVVTLYARHHQRGWVAASCPVWTLDVGGQQASKDTKGYGHWNWEGSLQVRGVKLAVYDRGQQAMVYVVE